MKNETIKKWLRENGFRYAGGQWILSNRGFGRRSADAVINSYHKTAACDTLDFLKKMGVIGFYQGVEYLPVFTKIPDFPIHNFYLEIHLSKKNQEIDRL